MERVHGNVVLRRRTKYTVYKSYTQYAPILKEDFHNMCGYCGKDFSIVKAERQTDHFIPRKFCEDNGFEDYVHKYENLVNSCRVCNRNKWDDWPTQSISMSHSDTSGYCDPASEEFDRHLSRNTDGQIVPISQIGQYMYDRLKFAQRPVNICWLIQELDKQLDRLEKKIDSCGKDGDLLEKYYDCNRILRKYTKVISEAKESL